MNKKGFTLIELLAVIVILSSISLVVVASVSSSLARRDKKECEEQVQLAKNAAKIYFSLNGGGSVTIKLLKDENYFSEKSKTSKLNEDARIEFLNDAYKYVDDAGNEIECE